VCCAVPLSRHDLHCGACLTNPPAFQQTWVACNYAAPLDQLILSLKFGHQLAVAPALAHMLAASLNSIDQPLPDLLMPVPLSATRLAQRGFNQSLEIARPLARLIGLPLYPRLLLRVRDTTAQSLLHPNQRRHNVRHAFTPDPDYEDKIRGRHIGVVDDVMTTGATLHEIATCLHRHGARRVSNLVFARTPPH
jgi:ComF family protein